MSTKSTGRRISRIMLMLPVNQVSLPANTKYMSRETVPVTITR